MRFAYADPPYLGHAARLYGHLHPEAAEYDKPETHRALIDRLVAEFPDGWALSCGSRDLRIFLPWCPEDVRVMPWCKRFAFFTSPTCDVQYAWEPVLVRGGRRSRHPADKPKDWVLANPNGMTEVQRRTLGVKGSKPETFCHWLFAILGARPGDELVDIFPGSGAVGRAWDAWCLMTRTWGGNDIQGQGQTALPFAAGRAATCPGEGNP